MSQCNKCMRACQGNKGTYAHVCFWTLTCLKSLLRKSVRRCICRVPCCGTCK